MNQTIFEDTTYFSVLVNEFRIGSRVSRWNAWFVAFVQKFMRRFARLISRGCATCPPVIEERLVLSDESITPRRVAPLGSWAYNTNGQNVDFFLNEETNLHRPATSPLSHSV